MNVTKPKTETTIAVPVLRGFTEHGTPLPAEPILCFDRNEVGSPYEILKRRLEIRNQLANRNWWSPKKIADFLDRLGFKA